MSFENGERFRPKSLEKLREQANAVSTALDHPIVPVSLQDKLDTL